MKPCVNMGKFSAFAGGVALSVLMLPTIVRTTDEALQIVPQSVRWAAFGIGAYNYQTVLKVVLPAAILPVPDPVNFSMTSNEAPIEWKSKLPVPPPTARIERFVNVVGTNVRIIFDKCQYYGVKGQQ